MEDLISVVIPVYQVEKYLNRCVDSVINQTYKNLEIILVDDGSPDNCPKICDEYTKKDTRITVIHKKNGGLSDARNAGIDIAKGEWITFIDSDDYISSDYIELLYNTAMTSKSDIAITSHKVIYENGTILEKATGERDNLSAKEVLKRILYDDGIDLSAWAKLYKKELFETIRYPKGRLFEDAATTYKLIDQCEKIAINSKSTYNYMIRKDSITNKNFSKSKMDLILSTQEMTEYIKQKYPDLEKACTRRLMYAYLSTLSQAANSSNVHQEYIKTIMKYINKNRRVVLKDNKIPKRDRIALYSTCFGFQAFKCLWGIYGKYTGRK